MNLSCFFVNENFNNILYMRQELKLNTGTTKEKWLLLNTYLRSSTRLKLSLTR
jgi:hypothetical protein